jgi:putative addiction module component (TIGR02574 family)
MTVAAQKQLLEKALALPKKARWQLVKSLLDSLETPGEKISRKEWNRLWKSEVQRRAEQMDSGEGKALSGAKVMAELTAVYGQNKVQKRTRTFAPKADVLSRKEWEKAWEKELEKRIEEMESGEDPGVPLEVIWADLRKLDKKR